MKLKFYKRAVALLLCAVMILASGCTLPGTNIKQEDIPESTQGEDLKMGKAADDVFSFNCNTKYSFNPLVATNHSNQLLTALVYENMVELDNNFEVIPNVVTEWEYNDAATQWRLTIDKDRTFHDGSPVTSKDLRYSLDRAITSDRYNGRFHTYQGAATDGDDKLVVTLGIGDTQFIKLLNIPIIKAGSGNEKFPQGSGPYKYVFGDLELLEENDSMTDEERKEVQKENEKRMKEQIPDHLIAYSGYKGYKKLPLDTIYLKEYTEAEDIINAFEDSYIDVTLNDPSSYTNLGFASTNEMHNYPTTNMHFIGINQESDLGKIAGFRFALQYAFDRAHLVDMLHNNAVDSALPMYPTCKDFPEVLNTQLKFDIEKTRNVLENNGFRDYDSDGWLEAMNGSSDDMTINFILCSDSSAKAGIAAKFRQDMGSIGVKVNVQELTWDDYKNAITDYESLTKEQKEDEDFKPISWDLFYGEIRTRNNFDCSELLRERTDDNKSSVINYTHSIGDGWETYMYNYLAASDATRKNAFTEFSTYLLTNVAQYVIIGFEKQQIITHRGAIRGINANYGNPLYGFQDWTIQLKEED